MRLTISKIFISMFLITAFCVGQDMNDKDSKNTNHLAPFEKLVGGKWHLQSSYQTFSWGVGKLSVKSESYFMVEGQAKKVSEGIWFWHPKEGKIKGYFTAINMPVEFFDYTVVFEDSLMKSDLKSYSSDGKESEYIETWQFIDENNFDWTLYTKTEAGTKKMMGGKYTRKE